MKKNYSTLNKVFKTFMVCGLISLFGNLNAQTLAFPDAKGFGKETKGARGHSSPQIYLVTNLNDSGAGSFRDAVSVSGRFVIFKVGGIIDLNSAVVVASNTTIAGQTATGEGIVLLGKVSFSGSSNTIARYIRIRNNDTNKDQDASGISNGANIILDHITFTWATDEVFSINWDSKGSSPDNITLQNCIIGQGLHRHNHSAGGLIQPSGGKISLIGNLYICNKTRNNKVKGINEFVNNVVYNWGNYGNTYGHTESGDAYIMGGDSAGRSDVNIINNYFIGGPNTSSSISTPFNRGNDNFYLYGKGNYFDNNRDGILNGALVPENLTGYPTGDAATILSTPYDYPMKTPVLSAKDAFDKIVLSVGASYPSRDQLDNLIISDLQSKGTVGTYVYIPSDLTTKFGFINGGAGHVNGATAPLDTDNDGMPDAWENANGLNKNSSADALTVSNTQAPYLNIEVYINGLVSETPQNSIPAPSSATFTNLITTVTPAASSLTVNWVDNATNENNYVVERSTNGTDFTVISTLGANVTSYNDSGLTPNTKYYYRVKATNSTGSSAYNAITSVTTPQIPPVPTKATLPTPSHNAINIDLATTLKWSGSTNTVSYAVYFGTTASNLTKLTDIAYTASPSYQITNLINGTQYYWRVDATNSNGTTTGDVWSFKTQPLELVGHWPFKEAPLSGTTIADITAYANNGKLATAFDNSSVRVTGKKDNALDFATSSDNMYIASIPTKDYLLFDKKSFTVSFWMKASPSLSTGSMYILCKGSITKNTTTGATGKRFDVEVKGGTLRFTIDDDITKREVTTSATPYFTGNWVNVVVMRNIISHKLQIYTNGVFTAEVDESATTGISEASDLIIGNIGQLELVTGSTNAPAPYKGAIDELKIFNYALTSAEVTALYNTANTSKGVSNKEIIDTEKSSQNNTTISVYPNPVKDKVFIAIPNYKKASATATLVDTRGKVVLKEQIVSDGNGLFSLDVTNKIASGIYILNATGEELNITYKIVVE